jgi:hypothetical protein
MKKAASLLAILALTVSMLSVMATTVIAVPPTEEGEYTITLIDVSYNPGTNLQNWTYRLTCISNPGISHVTFEFKTYCDPPLNVIDSAGGAGVVEISPDYDHPDPTTGKVGIKFENFPVGDGSIEEGESVDVWFTLVGEWPVGTIEAWIKAANNIESKIVAGPECRIQNRIPEIPFGTVMAGASMIAALAAYVVIRKRK